MPRNEILDRLGSIAFILGNKELPPDISREDYYNYKSIFSNDILNSNQSLIDTKISKDDKLLAELQENDSGISDEIKKKKGDDITTDGVDKEDILKPEDILSTLDSDAKKTEIENLAKSGPKKDEPEEQVVKEVKKEELSKEAKELDDLDSLLGSLDDILNEDIFDDDKAPVEKIDDKENDAVNEIKKQEKNDKTPIEEIVDETENKKPQEDEEIKSDSKSDIEDVIDIPNEVEDIPQVVNQDTQDIQNNSADDIDSLIGDIKLPEFVEEEDIIAKDKENSKGEEKKEYPKKDDVEDIDDEVDIVKEEKSQVPIVEKKEDRKENIITPAVNSDDIPSLDEIENQVDEEIENIIEKSQTDDNTDSDSSDDDAKDIKGDIAANLENDDDNETYQSSDNDDKENAVTTLPEPHSIFQKSRYGDLYSKYNSDKILKNIERLQEGIAFSVLDAILNETLNLKDMDSLLAVLEKSPSSNKISNILNTNKVSPKQIIGNTKKAIDLIPIPAPLKEYASVIRYAAIFIIGFIALSILAYQFIYKPLRSNSYFATGLEYIEKGNYETGELNFARGDRLKANQTKWYNKYANAYMDKEKFDEAYTKIQKSLNVNNKDFDNRMILGQYYRRRGENDLDSNLYDDGEKLYDDILNTETKKEKRIEAFDAKGILLMSRANTLNDKSYFKKSYDNYQVMLSLYGDNPSVRKRMMQVRMYQDDYEQVKLLKEYIDAMKNGYFDDDVYPMLARYLLYKDDFHGARTIYESVLKKYKDCLPAIVGYAEYETRLKHYDKAKNIIQNAAMPIYEERQIKKGKEFVYNLLGQIYYNQSQYGNATREFLNALELNPTYPDANYNLGNVYFYQENNYPKAKTYYQTAFSNMPPALMDEKLIYNLSWIHYLDKEYDRAFEGFLSLFNKKSDNVVVSYALANSLMHLDKDVLARGFYNNALTHILEMRGNLGQLKMRTEKEFALISYMASLYNNLGLSYAYTYTRDKKISDEQESFKNFVLSAQYFDQIRTSNVDLQKMEKRTVTIGSQNIAIPTYNIMTMQSRRNLKDTLAIDDYIPKIMNSIK